eukprot:CAMPEP_0172483966 /NCGR_PEP_ID=MMETSP1066-20121228/11213_1 /TAXON_ID=671091 /ORGANISM="Coscinodiscus wailesii, Strain CCMP2513" /LENGTH=318 /DNA_ID=CAMNT_0013248187 /DNA_START=205 /DNA_END=1161 /DNA_ORIENTATION=-
MTKRPSHYPTTPSPKKQAYKKSNHPPRKKYQSPRTITAKYPAQPSEISTTTTPTITTIPSLPYDKSNYLALDCEMVGTGPDGQKSACARVCIVNYNRHILLDTFVKVSEPVTDYRTFVSGVRACDIESDRAVSLVNCRHVVRELLDGKVLIGHGLKNDLQALGLTHPWFNVRDTAKYEPYMTTAPAPGGGGGVITGGGMKRRQTLQARKLKDLALQKLGVEIQVEGREHSPVEDAIAALELYKLASKKWEKLMEYKINKTRKIEEQREELQRRERASSMSSTDDGCGCSTDSSDVPTTTTNVWTKGRNHFRGSRLRVS